jgi:hypothetical protein
VLFALQDQGVEFVINDEIGYRMLGDDRRWDRSDDVPVVRVSTGEWAMVDRPGAKVIARHPGLDQEARQEMFLLQQDIKEAFADGELRLNDRGRQVAEWRGFENVPKGETERIDPDTVTETRFWPYGVHRRDVLLMIREDLLDASDWDEKLERYADLQETWDSQTVAVFLEPAAD